ncbi:AfsR/SARP family transcriptional regulator [Streptomyces sp. NPDC004690]
MHGGVPERLRIEVLGPVRARRGPARLDIGPARRQAVLTVLVLGGGTTVGHGQLLDGVWGDSPPPTGRRVLPSYVSPLRKALDPPGTGRADSVIRGGTGGYRFLLDEVELDVQELTEHAAQA